MKKLLLFLSFLLGLTLVGFSAFAVVPHLVYTNITITVGVPVTITPTNTGGAPTNSTLSTTIPGMSISATGVISGTPTTVRAATIYTITTRNTQTQNPSPTITITVVNPLPPAFTYATPPAYVYGTAITALTPGNTGGAATSCSGTLPAGLAVSAAGVISGTPTAISGTAVYTITAINAGGTTTANVTISVNPAPITITASDVSKVYGATLTNGTSTAFTTSGTKFSQTITNIIVTYGTGAVATDNVGNDANQVTPTGTTGGTFTPANYTITYAQGDINVTPKALTITGLTPGNKVYDKTTAETNLTGGTLVGVIAPDVVTLNTSAVFASANVGTAITVTSTSTLVGADAGNYTITQPALAKANITAIPLTVTGASANDKVYDGTNAATFTGSTLTGVLAGDAVTINQTGTFASVNVGANIVVTPTFTLGGAQAGNYTLTLPTGFNADITVKTLTVTGATATGKVYDGTTAVTFTGGTLTGVVAADNTFVILNKSGAFVSANVGTNIAVITTFTLSGTKAANYTLTQPSLTANITKKGLTVTANTQSRTYGAANPVFTVTITGFVGTDTQASLTTLPTASCTANATSAAGTYTIIPAGGFDDNYSFTTYTNGTLTIGKATLTATADNKSKNYGSANPILTITYTGFVNGENATVINTPPAAATTATAASNVGTYPITVTGGTDNNYTFAYVSGTLTIGPVPLTITAVSQSRSVGVNSTLTVTYTGLVNGNTQTNPLPTITCAATTASPVGSYLITLSGAADPNYIVTFVNGTLTITPAGPNGYDWTGAASTAWNNPANWNINGTPQTTVYPGSSSPGDMANIGVNFNYPTNRQPTVTAVNPNSVGTLNFGENGGNAITFTVTGVTLTVDGAVTQRHNSDQTDEVTNLAGTGTLTCTSFAVGDNTSQPAPTGTFTYLVFITAQSTGAIQPSVNTTTLNSSIANLTINGDITLNSQTSPLGNYVESFLGIINTHLQNYCISNPVFNLNAGIVTANNLITATSHYVNVLNDPLFGNVTTSEVYAMDLGATANTLKLLGATPLTIAQGANIDFVSGGTASVSTVNYANPSGTQKIYTSVDAINSTPTVYPTLTLSDLSSKTVDGGTLSTGSDFNTSGGQVNLTANDPSVAVGSTWTNSAAVTEGAGAVTVAGALANNVGGSIIGNTTTASTTVTGAYTNSGTLTCNSENFTFNGNYTNNAGATFTAGAGTVSFSGTAANQTLFDNSTAGSTFNKVFFNGTKQCIMTPGVGNFAVSSTGVLTMGGSELLVAGTLTYPGVSYLTLNSDAGGSAAIAAITAATPPISGNVSVQRFIHGDGNIALRTYRYFSSPIHNTTALSVLGTSYGYDLRYLSTSDTTYPITTGSGGTAGGFDQAGNPTIYVYREDRNTNNSVFSGGNFIGVANITGTQLGYDTGNNNTTSGYLPVGNGFAFFYRGTKDDLSGRTSPPISDPANFPNSTTVTQTGFLNQGTMPVNLWFNTATPNSYQSTLSYSTANTTGSIGFNLVGNPYACAIDWNNAFTGTGAIKRTTAAILPTIWLFNPSTKQYDTYITTSATTGVGSTASTTSIISSGQGFYVRTQAAGGTLAFTEAAKTSVSPTQSSIYMGLPAGQVAVQQLLRLKLAIDTINYDDIVIAFNSNASTVYNNQEDSKYLTGMGAAEGFASFSSDNTALSINSLPLPQKDPMIIKLDVEATNSGTLSIKKTQLDALPAIYEVWLMDKYKKDSLDLRNNANYAFTINKSDTASFGTNRFQIVIRQNQALGVHLLAFNALKVANGVQNIWKVENEQNYTNFTLERSTDKGITYTVLNGFLSDAQGTYSYLDKNPGKFTDMYRLKIEDMDGNITYSKVVTIVYSNSGNDNTTKNHISIYPNPARGMINLTIGDDVVTTTNSNLSGYQTSTMPTLAPSAPAPTTSSQSYDIKIINIIGYVVKTATSNQPSWQDNVSALLPGTYIIQVLNHSDKSLVGKSTFVKM